jgi:predicted MFS family arabinose efflux permease
MMIIGCFILGGGLLLYSQASSASMVYAAHTLLGTSLGFVGVLVCTVLVSNWFTKRRGMALGIVLTGTSFGGVLVPQIATPLIQAYGWRTAMIGVSLIIWLILLPAAVFLVKNRPSDVGDVPDGDPTARLAPAPLPTEQNGMTLGQALKTPLFWMFSICAALIFYAIFVVSQQLNLYLQGPKIGFSPQQAAGVQSLLFGLSVFGKFFYGFLADKFATTRVMLVSASTMFLSTLAFLYFDSSTVYVFAVLFGLNYGGTFVLLQLLVADYFGLREYGKILGAVTVIETMGGAAGTYITGRLADADGGDYSRAFLGLIVITGVSLAMVVILNFMNSKQNAERFVLAQLK